MPGIHLPTVSMEFIFITLDGLGISLLHEGLDAFQT
jgi:hypothetical protein